MDEARRVSEQIGEHYYQAELLRLQGLCAWQAGDGGRAQAILGRALELSEQQRKPGLAVRCALSLGALQATRGEAYVAGQRLRHLLDGLPQHGSCRDTRWGRQALRYWEVGQLFPSLEHTPWEPQ